MNERPSVSRRTLLRGAATVIGAASVAGTAIPAAAAGQSPATNPAHSLVDLETATVDQLRQLLDARRITSEQLVAAYLDRVHELGISTPNESGFPIIEVPLADADTVDEVGELLFRRGIYVTMAVYPLVPREEVGFRLQLTAANTDEQVDHLCGRRDARRVDVPDAGTDVVRVLEVPERLQELHP